MFGSTKGNDDFSFGSTSSTTTGFGTSSTQPSTTTGFSFGTPSTTNNDTSNTNVGTFSFAPTTTAPSTQPSTGFSFGSTPTTNNNISGGFSFGPTTTTINDSTTGFSFGTPSTTINNNATPNSNVGGFSFGPPPTTTAPTATTGFSFGPPPTSTTTTSTNSSDVGGFSFAPNETNSNSKFSFDFGSSSNITLPKEGGFYFGDKAELPLISLNISLPIPTLCLPSENEEMTFEKNEQNNNFVNNNNMSDDVNMNDGNQAFYDLQIEFIDKDTKSYISHIYGHSFIICSQSTVLDDLLIKNNNENIKFKIIIECTKDTNIEIIKKMIKSLYGLENISLDISIGGEEYINEYIELLKLYENYGIDTTCLQSQLANISEVRAVKNFLQNLYFIEKFKNLMDLKKMILILLQEELDKNAIINNLKNCNELFKEDSFVNELLKLFIAKDSFLSKDIFYPKLFKIINLIYLLLKHYDSNYKMNSINYLFTILNELKNLNDASTYLKINTCLFNDKEYDFIKEIEIQDKFKFLEEAMKLCKM
ncbi:hypothetical protein ABK040_010130 [Willaertia magna]